MTNEFIPYIIAVPHQMPAKIYADDRSGAGIVDDTLAEYDAGDDDYLNDCFCFKVIRSEADEDYWLDMQAPYEHQHATVCQLIIERRIEVENQK